MQTGGGVYVGYKATANFDNSQITSNEATQGGGAFYIDDRAKLVLSNFVVSGNRA